MENFISQLTNLPEAVALLVIVYFIIHAILAFLDKRKNNGSSKENKNQDVNIAILQTQMQTILENHLPHLEAELKQNTQEHKETQRMITEILIEIRK